MRSSKFAEPPDEPGVLVLGAYVDLNERRAGLAPTLEDSLHSSIVCRLRSVGEVTDWLAPLTLSASHLGDVPSATGRRATDKGFLPMSLEDYHRLVLLTFEQSQRGQGGALPEEAAAELEQLGLNPGEFVGAVLHFPAGFRRMVGPAVSLAGRAAECGRRWMHGARWAARVFR